MFKSCGGLQSAAMIEEWYVVTGNMLALNCNNAGEFINNTGKVNAEKDSSDFTNWSLSTICTSFSAQHDLGSSFVGISLEVSSSQQDSAFTIKLVSCNSLSQ